MLKSLSNIPLFLGYLFVAVLLVSAFIATYVRITPYHEFELIRDGNKAAALALGGALLGYVLPLASAISHSVGIIDMIIWGIVALAVQLGAFFVTKWLLPYVREDITGGKTASGVLLATFAIAAGILNAACMTY